MTETAAPDSTPPVSAKKKTATVVWSLGILIGVLGCLGAIATPKFITFSCKAKQSEAKTNLNGLFTAERAFREQHGFFTTDLVSLNWTPDGSPRYAYGFVTPSAPRIDTRIPALDPTRRTTLDPRVAGAAYSLAKTRTADGAAFTSEDIGSAVPAASASSNAFLAIALGDVDADGAYDVWSIDDGKNLKVVSNDCTN